MHYPKALNACMNGHWKFAFVAFLTLPGCRADRVAMRGGASMPIDAFYEQRRLLKAGFEPADALVRGNIEVQRAQYIIGLLHVPSVEVRHVGDTYRVSLNHHGQRATATVKIDDWQHLMGMSRSAFAPLNERAYKRAYRSLIKKAGYCHSWTDIESTQGGVIRRLQASICFKELQAASLSYSDAIARLAVDNVKECESDRATPDLMDALQTCAERLGPPTSEFRAIER